MSIILRSVKGSELTFAEVDDNFQSFFYSSSVSGGILNLHFYDNTSQSINLSSVPSISASYAATASYVLNAQSASYVLNAISASFASTIASGLNITASNILVTGTASIVYSQIITSSIAFTSGSNLLGANSGDKQTLWGTIDLKSGPLLISGSTTALDSITAPSFTGSLQGTASWADNAVTASYVLNAISSSYAATASYVQNAITASYALNSPSSTFATSSLSSSYASSSTSASYAAFATSASYASSSTSASYATNALSASYAATASYVLNAISASYATFAQNAFSATTASYTLYTSLADAALYAGTASFATSSISSSFASTASYVLNAISASYASSSTSASYATNALSASYAATASYVLNAVSSSRSISSSYAITSSYSAYAENANTATSATTAGSATTATVAANATTASYALTASYATTASYVQNAISSSHSISSSYAITSSYSEYAENANNASYALTANNALAANSAGTATSASYAQTASYIPDAITNNIDNYILTATGGGTINGESNLTFDGLYLTNEAAGGTIRLLDTVNNTLPTAGITSFVEKNSIPNALNKYYGETISGIASASLSTGQIIYLTANADEWDEADCTTSSKENLLGICLNNAGAGDPITVLLQGFVVTDAFSSYASYQPGLPLYLSTAGNITDSAPGVGQNRIIGHYYKEIVAGTYSIRFNPDNYWV